MYSIPALRGSLFWHLYSVGRGRLERGLAKGSWTWPEFEITYAQERDELFSERGGLRHEVPLYEHVKQWVDDNSYIPAEYLEIIYRVFYGSNDLALAERLHAERMAIGIVGEQSPGENNASDWDKFKAKLARLIEVMKVNVSIENENPDGLCIVFNNHEFPPISVVYADSRYRLTQTAFSSSGFQTQVYFNLAPSREAGPFDQNEMLNELRRRLRTY